MWSPDPSIIKPSAEVPGTAAYDAAQSALSERLAQFPNLEPDQFWFVVRAAGHEAELRAWVAALNDPGTVEAPNPAYDPMMWAAASAKLDFAKFFERDHPLVEAARLAIGMSQAELDDLWRYAAA